MKRRQLIRYAQAGFWAVLGTGLASGFESYQAQTKGTLTVQWLGHTCFLFTGGGQRVLVNPFRPIGCTAGYRAPKVSADLVLISSQLLDEGAVEGLPGDPKLLYESGVYQVNGLKIQGITTDHDRLGGRRFGKNVVWRWTQAGVNILHLGGSGCTDFFGTENSHGLADLVLVPVGGGTKAYTPQEAKQALDVLNPKLVIPTHYRTQAAKDACDITPVDDFLTVMSGATINRPGNSITIKPSDLPANGPIVKVLSYKF